MTASNGPFRFRGFEQSPEAIDDRKGKGRMRRNVFKLIAVALIGVSPAIAQNTALTSFVETSLPGTSGLTIQRVFYVDANNNVQGLASFGEPAVTSLGSLTQSGGSEPTFAGSALTSFADSFGIQHVFYADFTSNVHELYRPYEDPAAPWSHNQLTQGATGAPPLQDSQTQLSSCFDNHNIEHVFYIDENDHVIELYNNGKWWSNDLTEQTNTAGAIPRGEGSDFGSGLTSFCDTSGNANVFYTSSINGTKLLHINYLRFDGSHWSNTDLTAQTEGPIAAAANALTSFQDSFGFRHVFYFASDHSVRELYELTTDGPWFGNNLTSATNSPVAIVKSGLTSFFDTNNIEHVYYVDDANNHVRELYNDGQWATNDLSARTGSPIPVFGGGLTSFFDRLGEHVFYIGLTRTANSDIIELYFANGSWGFEDLTSTSGAPGATP